MTPRAVLVFQDVGAYAGLRWVGVPEGVVDAQKKYLRYCGTPAIAVIRLRRQTTEGKTCDASE